MSVSVGTVPRCVRARRRLGIRRTSCTGRQERLKDQPPRWRGSVQCMSHCVITDTSDHDPVARALHDWIGEPSLRRWAGQASTVSERQQGTPLLQEPTVECGSPSRIDHATVAHFVAAGEGRVCLFLSLGTEPAEEVPEQLHRIVGEDASNRLEPMIQASVLPDLV